jgi:hypothetical protein
VVGNEAARVAAVALAVASLHTMLSRVHATPYPTGA